MPKESERYRDQISALRLLSPQEPPRALERNAIALLRKDVEKEEQEEAERERELDQLTTRLRAPLLDVLGQDKRVAQGKKDLLAFYRKRKNFKPATATTAVREESSISSGSIVLTVTPPYDFQLHDVWQKGPVTIVNSDAKKSVGFMMSDVKCDGEDEAGGVARSYLGIAFKPLVKGLLTFSCTPSPLIGYWGTWAYFATARSRGSVGLKAYQFKLDGTPDPSGVIAKTDVLWWYDDSWWPPGAGDNNVAWHQTLSLLLNVDPNHFYNFWVYFRASAKASGQGLTYWSASRAEMNGTIPSMSLSLKPTISTPECKDLKEKIADLEDEIQSYTQEGKKPPQTLMSKLLSLKSKAKAIGC
jgi:hypothetical protein